MTYRKIGQGQARVIFYIKFVEVESPSFKIIGLLVLEKILKLFTIYGHGGHLDHVTWTIYINFFSPFLRRLHMNFGFDWPRGTGWVGG